ncbi:MFS transporter [Streptosporangium sp. NPDC020072]|uniref:MFS transporter n=1 Tax=Streptosporangium jomthongense TaxID=1193683 RepID=A0ABV8F4M2_9ACTN
MRTPVRTGNWTAVVAVALGTFSVVTTEMLPVGLLTAMSAELGVSAGTAGLVVTVPGLVGAIVAPVLVVAVGGLDRRRVLVALAALLAVANLLSALAPVFAVMLAARVLVGLSIGGFWAVAAGLGARLAPERAGTATSLIFSGVSLASVLGVPSGTFAGELVGWRPAFAALGVLALVLLVALVLTLPPLPALGTVRARELPGLLRNARLRLGLVVVLLMVTGHFAAYTYVRPVLEQVSGVGPGLVGTLLLVYGLAGVMGNFVAGAVVVRARYGTVLAVAGLLGVCMFALPLAGETRAAVVVSLAAWGLAYGGVSVSMQTWVLTAAPKTPEAGSALFVAVFNAAISLGALLGGRVVDTVAVSGVMWAGGALALLAVPVVVLAVRRRGSQGDRDAVGAPGHQGQERPGEEGA